MEDKKEIKRETKKELELDQVEEVIGGIGIVSGDKYPCQYCGRTFVNAYTCIIHQDHCSKKPGN